jgi:3-deoxy-manno-octulosonate cytidylyltransferase (CMP-KDO synthetase)
MIKLKKKVLGVIPARYGSVRLPGKPLALLDGKPMVQWVYEAAARAISQVIVATDDKRIVDVVEKFGGRAMMTPVSCSSGTDRMAFVARKLKADFYVNIQGDEPLMRAEAIKKTVELAIRKKSVASVATDLKEEDYHVPHVVKVVCDKDSRALYFSRSLLPFPRENVFFSKPMKHLGLYVYPRKALFQFVSLKPSPLEQTEKLEQLRALYNGMPIYMAHTKFDSIGVDTKSDLKAAEKHLKKN